MLLLAIMATGVLMTDNLYAFTPPAKSIREILIQNVPYPGYQAKNPANGEVEVVFTLSDEGKVQVKSIKGSSPYLENYVKEALSGICCTGVVSPYNQHYRVTFTFRMT